MATGDVVISIQVEGGVTKSAMFDSATRTKAKLYVSTAEVDLSADADWQVYVVNKAAAVIVAQANKQLEGEITFTPKTFTAAT